MAVGTYALVLRASRNRRVRVGRLGWMQVRRGYYVYVGSAWGPGGLAARVGRHRRAVKRLHWHVDYLRRVTRLEEVVIAEGVAIEHAWAARIAAQPGARVALPAFGSSDCTCPAHLYWFPRRPNSV